MPKEKLHRPFDTIRPPLQCSHADRHEILNSDEGHPKPRNYVQRVLPSIDREDGQAFACSGQGLDNEMAGEGFLSGSASRLLQDCADYFLGFVLFRHPATRSVAMEILNRVMTGDLSVAADVTDCTRTRNPTVDRCRKKLLQTISKNWKEEWVLEPGLPCDDRHCGRVDQAKCSDEFWVEDDRLPRTFCSQECRWMYEAKTFFENI